MRAISEVRRKAQAGVSPTARIRTQKSSTAVDAAGAAAARSAQPSSPPSKGQGRGSASAQRPPAQRNQRETPGRRYSSGKTKKQNQAKPTSYTRPPAGPATAAAPAAGAAAAISGPPGSGGVGGVGGGGWGGDVASAPPASSRTKGPRKKSIIEKYAAPAEDESLKALKLMRRIKEKSELHNLSDKKGNSHRCGGTDAFSWAASKHPHVDNAHGPIVQLARLRQLRRQQAKARRATEKQAKVDRRRQVLRDAQQRVAAKNAAFEVVRAAMQGEVARLAKAGDFAASAEKTKELKRLATQHKLDLKPLHKQQHEAAAVVEREEAREKAEEDALARRRAAGEILPEDAEDAAFIPWPPWGERNQFKPMVS